MSKRTIFVSCGQFTAGEKALGKAIVEMVDKVPGLKAYFAEEVQDLNGLVSNILGKLHECDGFITVMHGRGTMARPNGPEFTRASVWIEQEIAIATYIRHIEKRPLPVIAFRHRSVGLEGIRSLVHLNPIEFTDESEVLAALPPLLQRWQGLPATGIRVELRSITMALRDGHPLRRIEVNLVNDSHERIKEFTCLVRVPAGLRKHFSGPESHAHQMAATDPSYALFRVNERNVRPIEPHETVVLTQVDYCTRCAIDDLSGRAALGGDAAIEATVWIGSREYKDVKTLVELAEERELRER